MVPANPKGYASLIIDDSTDLSKLPDEAWVNQGVSAMKVLAVRGRPHTHRVYVRADGYLQILSSVPQRGYDAPAGIRDTVSRHGT